MNGCGRKQNGKYLKLKEFDLSKIIKDEGHKSTSFFNRILTRTVVPYIVRLLYYLKITPTQVNVGRTIPLLFSYYFFMTDRTFLSGLFFLFYWILDHSDGALARAIGVVSNLGGFIDNVMDFPGTTIFLGLIIIKHDVVMGVVAMCVTTVGFTLLYLKLAYVSELGTRPEAYYRLLKRKIDLTILFGGDAHIFWLCIGLMSGLLDAYLVYLILAGILENANMVLVSINQISEVDKQNAKEGEKN